MVAIITRDAARGARAEAWHERRRGREGDLRDGGAVNRGTVPRRRRGGGARAAIFVPLARADVSEGELAYANFAIARRVPDGRLLRAPPEGRLVRGAAKGGATAARRNESRARQPLREAAHRRRSERPGRRGLRVRVAAQDLRDTRRRCRRRCGDRGRRRRRLRHAATTISVESYRSLFARALADEARHLAVLSAVATGKPVGNAFPTRSASRTATTSLEPYLG